MTISTNGAITGVIQADQAAWLASSVSGGGNRLGDRVAVLGDSFAFQCTGGNVNGMTFTRSGGVVTVTGATSHTLYPGAPIAVVGMASSADEMPVGRVLAYVSSSSFTYAHAGPDGVMAQNSGNQGVGAVQAGHVYQNPGFWCHYNRLTSGAYNLVRVAGFPGATTDHIATKVAAWIAPATPNRIIYLAGYNDINNGRTVEQTVASIKASVDAYPYAFWDIFSTFPFNSGAAANTAANLKKLSGYYQKLKVAFAGYAQVRVHDSLRLFGLSTGLARTGYITTDNIHPTPRLMYECAKYIYTLDGSTDLQTPIPLPVNSLDTIGVDAASKYVIDNPLMTGSQAATAPATGVMPTGVQLSLTGTAAAGVSSIPARADGFGNDWQIVVTPGNADNVLRMSVSGLNARFISGATIEYIVMRASVSNIVTANVEQFGAVMVWIADGVTYAAGVQDAVGSATSITAMQQDDATEVVITLRNIKVPTFTSLTTARVDFNVNFLGASATPTTVKLGQLQIKMAD